MSAKINTNTYMPVPTYPNGDIRITKAELPMTSSAATKIENMNRAVQGLPSSNAKLRPVVVYIGGKRVSP